MQTFMQRIEAACLPGAKEARQAHPGGAACRAAAASADLARHDQGPQRPLGLVILRRHALDHDEDKQLVLMAQEALR
jgi:hypothetical protein